MTCRWRMVLSTCLLIWSFSSLFITHRLLKHDTIKKEDEHESISTDVNCETVKEDSSSRSLDRKRQVVKGWCDFRGELLPVDSIDKEDSEDFSNEATEFDLEVGVGRHDHSFSYTIYDQVSGSSSVCLVSETRYGG